MSPEARYSVGQRLRVMAKVDSVEERCSLGQKHTVHRHEVRIITVTEVESRLIKFLNYDSDGIGNRYYAVDSWHRTYVCTDSWEGTAYWQRNQDGRLFNKRPFCNPARDLNGNLLS